MNGDHAYAPPEDLVVYEVEGGIPPEEEPELGDGFLGFWLEAGYTFLFFDRESDAGVASFLSPRPGLSLRAVHRMKYWEWQDGARFSRFSVGPLTIVPIWEGADAAAIRLDPGLAFGFGGHPTTRACLESLAALYRHEGPATVLDLGTGTGILSLAAIRLGASAATAVEYSHVAARAALRNVEVNNMDGRVTVVRGLAEDYADRPAELLMANLHAAVLREVIGRGGLRGRRRVILSGVFHAEAEEMEAHLAAEGFTLYDRRRDERWVTLVGGR